MNNTFREVLVCYDIEETKNRTKLFEGLKNLGLIPIQKSVMWGTLINAEIKEVSRLFNRYCKKEDDRAFLVETELSKHHNAFSKGYSIEFEDYRRQFKVI